MRKHFLLLFLMALLPLAGFAADISTIWTVTAPSFSYGGTQALTVKQGESTISAENYTATYYKEDKTTQITGEITAQDYGNYWVKVSGVVAKGFEGDIFASFQITKGTITVKVKEDSYFVKNYKAADPASIAYNTTNVVIAFSAQPNGENIANSVNTGTVTYSYGDNQNANFQSDGTTPLTTGDKGYKITFAGITLKDAAAANYDLAWEDRYMKIKQIVFDNTAVAANAVGFTITETSGYAPASPYTYKSQHQAPTYKVEWRYGTGANDKMELTAGTDYKVRYNNSTLSSEGDEAIQAGSYTANFAAANAKGNFVINGTATKNKLGEFTINKANLAIMVMPRSKVYDGAAFAAGEAQFSVTGWVANDLSATIATTYLSVNATDAAALKKDAADYQVKAALDDAATFKRGGTTVDIKVKDNYEVNVAVPTLWTIERREFTLKPADQTKVYGAALPDLTADGVLVVPVLADDDPATDEDESVTAGAISAAEATTIKSAMKLTYGNEDEEATTPVALNADSPIGTYPTGVKLAKLPDDNTDGDGTTKISNDQRAVLKNYTITLENAKFTITGAPFRITPLVSVTQYGTPVAPAAVAYNEANQPIAINNDEVAFEYYKDGVKLDAAPTERGSYVVKIVRNPNIAKGNYAGGVITYQDTPFSIIKKQLNIVVPEVKLWNNATKTILNRKYKIDTNALKVGDDVLEIELDFTTTAVAGLTVGAASTDYKITFSGYAAAGVDNVIIAKLKAGENDNANYEIATSTGGRLLETDLAQLDLELDGDAEKVVDAVDVTASNANVIYDVTIKNRKLNADKWNVLVLPFDVEPLDFCNTIDDYAVFNTLTSASGENVKFSLARTTIAANTPFLVKPTKEIDFDEINNNNTPNDATDDYRQFVFAGVVIKGGTPTVTVGDAQFIGTYETITVEAGNYAMQGGSFVPLTAAATLGYTRAYLNLATTAPARITVEEADGTTTAISTITADGVAVAADGWYTLNGVKLQSMPTEKGIYINNGKKVVVK